MTILRRGKGKLARKRRRKERRVNGEMRGGREEGRINSRSAEGWREERRRGKCEMRVYKREG